MKIPPFRRISLAVAFALVSLSAAAEGRVPIDRATTTQKAIFIENLITNSVAARTIEQSGDAAAIASLQEARSLIGEAKRDIDRGALPEAEAKLDQALALVNEETRRLSHDDLKDERQREAYERRLSAVRTFLMAYQRVAENGGGNSVATQAAIIRSFIDKAEGQAGAGRLDDAIGTLDQAYVVARGDIREIRDGQTLVRTLEFETAKEEYDYEIGRNQSHFMLLQFALGDKQPTGSVVGRINEHRVIAEKLRSRAEARAAEGAHAEAIDLLNESTNRLLSAIRMSGVFVPG